MDHEGVNLEERLKSLLSQLRTELGILDRIVYKGKNQHRHCLYFQYLLKVRRDAKLLLSADVKEVLSVAFQVINGKKPTQKVYHLERLKKKKSHNTKHNFLERLLGIARLLSQMVEPMLKAAIQISSLLAQSFFMGFSLTNLAILARLRVLVQQMLLDIVCVFNMVSSLSQEEQLVKLSQEGVEVFREYYPSNRDFLTLECMWEGNKLVLRERTSKSKKKTQYEDLEKGRSIPLETSTIQYQSIEISSEVDSMEERLVLTNVNGHATNAVPIQQVEIDAGKIDNSGDGADMDSQGTPSKEDATEEGHRAASIIAFRSPTSLKSQTQCSNKVAFISIRKSAPSESNEGGSSKRLKVDGHTDVSNKIEDPFFSFLTDGSMKDSLF